MFGHVAHFSPKKYSVQKKNLSIPHMNFEVKLKTQKLEIS